MVAGACDCHTHVFGPRADYPMVDARHYTPGPAPLAALRAHLAGLGLERVVLVQPSVYGTDNRCMLDALARLDGAGRGIVVLEDGVDAAALRELHARGVRGVRINLESAGLRDIAGARALLQAWSARVADLGWHVQLYAAQPVVQALADDLARLPSSVVLDHFALADVMPGGDALTDLLRTGCVHVKLSAPYRLASPALGGAWARHWVDAVPGALLWASDWPHTARGPGRAAHEVSAYRAIPANGLRQEIARWLPSAELRRRVLVDNPARLYGF
ncbi:amidohydrolase family protein [Alicycliphilus denitrificans]|uniref:Amidohydrolase 2 n=2 Tax=Alicycliphilus denitrificans TaxID=179636 RepID=F4G734_ALIDK|nr:amidohydrolase family protein [Alicycliphilus denitrificans]AEB83200.1 amidohydrolase 2 [Alicycliphilus denitrificans K601]QKD42969.1 amidohydrolase family protein [Alicycliphilus denitrificans]